MRYSCLESVAATLLLTVSAASATAADARLPMPDGGTLVLAVPEGWRSAGKAGRTPTLSITPAAGGAFAVLVSTFPSGAGPNSPTEVRTMVEGAMANAQPLAVEPKLVVKQLRSTGVQGHYFSATDKAPKPGEFQYMTQGAALVGGQPVAFTILSNGDPASVNEPALRMLAGARRE